MVVMLANVERLGLEALAAALDPDPEHFRRFMAKGKPGNKNKARLELSPRLRAALVEFATRYNETWLVARHGYKTPAQVRAEQTTPQPAIDQPIDLALSLAA